jgi:acetyl-CoA synthetase
MLPNAAACDFASPMGDAPAGTAFAPRVRVEALVQKRLARVPNLSDYAKECASFSWERARSLLTGLPGQGGLNIAFEALDRHVAAGRGERLALRWLPKTGAAQDLSFRELTERASRFANLLSRLGVMPGERVFALAGRIPALYAAALGALRHRAVFCPMFSAFGPEPVQQRLSLGDGRVLVTTPALYARKVASLRARLPGLAHVLLAGRAPGEALPPDTLDLDALLAAEKSEHEISPTRPSDPALLHFTSGTTGKPKGALHVHEAVVAHVATARYALDLQPGDVFWCTADPGWVTGTSYGIVAPLALGVASIVDESEFEPRRWYETLERERVSVWYTAPTAVRMLIKAGSALARERPLPALRFVASVGEPLNPEAVTWGLEAFGLPIHDNWWQTETGGIMVANYAALPIKPGSMGKPLPGIEAAIVARDGAAVRVLTEPETEGELALRAGWPSMFRAYLGEEERYRKCFADGWYLSGDLVRADADGYYWFVGRADDVIKSSGHLVGPFEVESALMAHPSVLEAGVIGKPDPIAGAIIKAFVALKPGVPASNELARELLGFARSRLGPAVAPKEIAFVDALPKTRSGKVLRRLLKARELGLPEGDLSTLEPAS